MVGSTYQLKSDLARVCLPAPERGLEQRLAWMNSVCILFLLIGILGAPSGLPSIRKLPPLEQPIPVIVEPLPPAQPAATEPKPEQSDSQKPEAPPVVAVTLDTPKINFSVPTVGNLLVPESAAVAPPVAPLRQPVETQRAPIRITSTGEGGDRRSPPYPDIARQMGVQGTVVLQFSTDPVGAVQSVEVKETSGSSLLDRNALSYIKRHWIVPPVDGNHLFQVAIRYTLTD